MFRKSGKDDFWLSFPETVLDVVRKTEAEGKKLIVAIALAVSGLVMVMLIKSNQLEVRGSC